MNHAQIEQAFAWRYAVKKYDPNKKISQADWQILAKSLQMAPSSYGLQPYKFLVVQDPSLRAKLHPVSWNQSQVLDASHFVVILAREKVTAADVEEYVQLMANTRNISVDSLGGFRDMLLKNIVTGLSPEKAQIWAQKQTYIAMGFLLETAALLGVDSTPMEGLDPLAYDKILSLEGTGWKTVAAVALGYRHPDDANQKMKKVRRHQEQLIQFR